MQTRRTPRTAPGPDRRNTGIAAEPGQSGRAAFRRHIPWQATAAAALLIGCTAPDAHIPPFAKDPYEPFSREAVVAIALREWRLFGQQIDDDSTTMAAKLERAPGLWQRVGEYWWLGLKAGAIEAAWTGKHGADGVAFPEGADGSHAWSAAFISYVLRMAGAGDRFPYAPDHADYVNTAKRMADGTTRGWVVVAEAPDAYVPQEGDLICRGRLWAASLRYEDLPAGRFPAHCDVVVATKAGQITVVGGNVRDAVTLRHVPVGPEGRLAGPGGVSFDPRGPWLAVLRLAAAETPLPEVETGSDPAAPVEGRVHSWRVGVSGGNRYLAVLDLHQGARWHAARYRADMSQESEMDRARRRLAVGLVAAIGLGSAAQAQPMGPGGAVPPGPGMMGQGMGPGAMGPGAMGQGPTGQGMRGPGMMGRGMAYGDPAAYLDGLKRQLGITAPQEPAWNDYAEAVKGVAGQMRDQHQIMFDAMGTATWQERRDMMNRMFESRQQAMATVHEAAEKLLPTLTTAQKTSAQRILPGLAGPTGRGHPGRGQGMGPPGR